MTNNTPTLRELRRKRRKLKHYKQDSKYHYDDLRHRGRLKRCVRDLEYSIMDLAERAAGEAGIE